MVALASISSAVRLAVLVLLLLMLLMLLLVPLLLLLLEPDVLLAELTPLDEEVGVLLAEEALPRLVATEFAAAERREDGVVLMIGVLVLLL